MHCRLGLTAAELKPENRVGTLKCLSSMGVLRHSTQFPLGSTPRVGKAKRSVSRNVLAGVANEDKCSLLSR